MALVNGIKVRLRPWPIEMIMDANTTLLLLDHTANHVAVQLPGAPRPVLSSAVLNGGLVQANHIVNMRVPKQMDDCDDPASSLQRYCEGLGCSGTAVGMMTAASMDSYRLRRQVLQGVEIVALVTCGLNNARRVGDVAEYRSMVSQPQQAGTINIVVVSSARLAPAAMVEATMMITEAKTAALVEAGITSALSQQLATGTGTDVVAVVGGHGPQQVQYCGKHVLFGEVLGRLVFEAVADSVSWYRRNNIIPAATTHPQSQ